MKHSSIQSAGRLTQLMNAVGVVSQGLRRGLIRGVAVATMLVMYSVASIGSFATTTVSVAGLSGLALAASAKPANAWRRRRRYWGGPSYRRGYYRRRYYGGWPYRRRRRHRGFNLYLNF